MRIKPILSSIMPMSKKIENDVDGKATADEINELIKMAKDHIVWSTSFHPNLFDRQDIRQSMNDAIARGVHIDMLIGKSVLSIDSKPEEFRWLMSLQNNAPSGLVVREYNQEIHHYVIIDSKHIRIEKPHSYLVCGNTNEILYNSIIARRVELRFFSDPIWKSGSRPLSMS